MAVGSYFGACKSKVRTRRYASMCSYLSDHFDLSLLLRLCFFSLHDWRVSLAGAETYFCEITVTLMTKFSVLFWLFGHQYFQVSAVPLKQSDEAVFRTSALFGDHMVLQATEPKSAMGAALLRGYTSPHEVKFVCAHYFPEALLVYSYFSHIQSS